MVPEEVMVAAQLLVVRPPLAQGDLAKTSSSELQKVMFLHSGFMLLTFSKEMNKLQCANFN